MTVTDEMQRQAKALGEPSRFQIFRHITDSDQPVGVAELTELLGFNHNAIRQHLTVLVEAGLVAESTERRTTPGRPRKHYTARLDALNAFGAIAGSYQRLAELLLDVATGANEPYQVGLLADIVDRAAGPTDDPTTTVTTLVDQLTIDGFQPATDHAEPDRIVLGCCPFADVAAKAPEVICELHRGLLDGHLRRRGSDLQSLLQPRDPHRAGCEILLTSPAVNQSTGEVDGHGDGVRQGEAERQGDGARQGEGEGDGGSSS